MSVPGWRCNRLRQAHTRKQSSINTKGEENSLVPAGVATPARAPLNKFSPSLRFITGTTSRTWYHLATCSVADSVASNLRVMRDETRIFHMLGSYHPTGPRVRRRTPYPTRWFDSHQWYAVIFATVRRQEHQTLTFNGRRS